MLRKHDSIQVKWSSLSYPLTKMAAPMNAGVVLGTSEISRKLFTMEDDLFLLCEVLALIPFEDPKRWVQIMESINQASQRGFTIRAVKERVELLLSLFKKDDREKLKG